MTCTLVAGSGTDWADDQCSIDVKITAGGGHELIGVTATLIVMLALAPFATRIFAEPSDAGHEPAI
ncbi:MAG: hypothetical protein WAO41_02310 [Candidatus Nanopelagicales bacterium]